MRPVIALAALGIVSCGVPHYFSSGDTGATHETGEECTCAQPDNTWPSDAEAPGICGDTDFEVGKQLPDFLLFDQHGADVSLCQLHGNVVLMDISTIWCGPCQNLAEDAEATWQDYKDEGFVYVTVLAENITSGDPTVDDLNFWVDEFGLTSPVLGDPGKAWSLGGVDEEEGDAYPRVMVLDRDLVVRHDILPPFTDEGVRAAIEAEL